MQNRSIFIQQSSNEPWSPWRKHALQLKQISPLRVPRPAAEFQEQSWPFWCSDLCLRRRQSRHCSPVKTQATSETMLIYDGKLGKRAYIAAVTVSVVLLTAAAQMPTNGRRSLCTHIWYTPKQLGNNLRVQSLALQQEPFKCRRQRGRHRHSIHAER